MLMLLIDENRFLATGPGLDTGYRMIDDWVDISDVDDNECGRFSISSWLVDALPHKLKKSPKFTQIWNNLI